MELRHTFTRRMRDACTSPLRITHASRMVIAPKRLEVALLSLGTEPSGGGIIVKLAKPFRHYCSHWRDAKTGWWAWRPPSLILKAGGATLSSSFIVDSRYRSGVHPLPPLVVRFTRAARLIEFSYIITSLTSLRSLTALRWDRARARDNPYRRSSPAFCALPFTERAGPKAKLC
jgi:hypothetical protein